VADFTAPNTYSIGAGGGCLGAHTGAVYAATQELKGKRIAVPWADTPPGVVCYYDLEKKPLDVLQGSVTGDSDLAGTIPDLQQIGVPIKPASPDITPQVTQVLDFKPDVIIFSAQGADCWNLVDGLGRLGWTPDKIPLIMTGSCVDLQKQKAAGDLAKGVYFISSPGANVADPDSITDPRYKLEATSYVTKAKEYGMPDADITKGFGGSGWNTMMTLWEQTGIIANGGKDLTRENLATQLAGTKDNHIFGSVPFGCADAPPPYTAICSTKVALVQWDGTTFQTINPLYSGADLVSGTPIKPGP
jgi:branched-chain amino acid transport system substrate-binding protein